MSSKYQLVFEKKYIKDLKHVHPDYHQAIYNALLALQDNPRPVGSIKLKGASYLFRIRIGPYRVIYSIIDKKLLVLIIEIGDRKDIYR
jgi:mRNA interferase RelE/StbE